MAWSPPAHIAGIVWVSAPGDYATFNSNHTPDGTAGCSMAGVAYCPLSLTSPRMPPRAKAPRSLLGTVLLGRVLQAGHRRYAQTSRSTAQRSGQPAAAGQMRNKVLRTRTRWRRNLRQDRGSAGTETGLQGHLDYSVAAAAGRALGAGRRHPRSQPPLYGEQEGAELGYNPPQKPGRPSHTVDHTYMAVEPRDWWLECGCAAGDQHNVKHATGGLWSLLDRWQNRGRWPRLLRGLDLAWGHRRRWMAQAEQRNLAYLFRLRTTKNVSRALQRAMAQSDWLGSRATRLARQGGTKSARLGRVEPAAAGHSAAPPTQTSAGDRRSRRPR